MAVYSIAATPTRACPVNFTRGDFWKDPENFSLTVKNTDKKTITNLSLTAELFLAPQDLRRPFNAPWSSTKPIPPGQEQALEKRGFGAASAQTVLGWVFFPSSIKYEDGSTWRPQSEGECFKVFWRDPQHADIPTLPPRQVEINPD